MIDIKRLNLEDEVKYKLECGQTITLTHVLVKDWYALEPCFDILETFKKNESDNELTILMSELDYVKTICKNENREDDFGAIVVSTIKEANNLCGGWNKNKNKTVYVVGTIEQEVLFYITNKDFQDIKKIILHQNFYNYDDTYLSPKIREARNKKRAIESKGFTSPTLEKQKIFVMGKTGFTKNALNDMTYRDFSQLYKQKVDEDIYFARNILKSGYSCTIDGNITHPLFEKEQDVLGEMLIDADSFVDKVNQANKI